ncbi:hypothetical protein Q9L58_008858 [Maublancomyces gigas]|uniref:Cupredoxin n=1 Tax=Discina gigas TaxID=1032678 RepID=A0ABR3G8I1_9PEZI
MFGQRTISLAAFLVLSSEALAATHKVVVGGPGLLTYVPSSVEAAAGDIIEFDFLARNHTLTQSSFDTPCSASAGGVDSGFRPNIENVAGKQIFTYTVTNISPAWFFCGQGAHCEAGMVFAVNPGNKFAEYVAKATGASPPASPPTSTSTVTPTPSSTSSPTAAPVTHKVVVGGPGLLTYVPSSVEAAAGDIIEFDFLARNHTLTQSSFDTPCSASAGGVDSGFRPNIENVAGKQIFTYTVTNTSPAWFFCGQGTHCKAGMVFAVNPGNKFAEYVAKATSASTPTPTASPTPSSTPSPTAAPVTHKVIVGGPGQLTYVPSSVEAVAGDIIEFNILARNHTVTQSSFDTPCSASAGGVTSGFRPNLDNVSGKQIFTYTVVDSSPAWFFCDQGTHCESGMVFAVNPGSKFADYLAKANGTTTPSGNATIVTPDIPAYTGSASSRAAPWAMAGVAGLLAFFL